ncbi:MAG: adenylate/guanylate cyclase domain-containing protein [Vampirovibrionales bacterium]
MTPHPPSSSISPSIGLSTHPQAEARATQKGYAETLLPIWLMLWGLLTIALVWTQGIASHAQYHHTFTRAAIEGCLWSLMFGIGSYLVWQKPSKTWMVLWLTILTIALTSGVVHPTSSSHDHFMVHLAGILSPIILTGMVLAQRRLLWFDTRMRHIGILWQKTQIHLKHLQAHANQTSPVGKAHASQATIPHPVRHDLTAMFIDLRNFTTMGESLPAPDMIDLLNEFYGITAQCVHSAGGWVNKYLGDGVLVLFGVNEAGEPHHPDTHALDAVKASLLLMNRLNAMATRWQKERFLNISVGMSIHSGITLVGCFGQHSSEINVVGDTINLCSRLQDINKQFKTQLIVSGATKQRLQEGETLKTCLLHLGEVEIRGRDSKVGVFTLATAMQVPDAVSNGYAHHHVRLIQSKPTSQGFQPPKEKDSF